MNKSTGLFKDLGAFKWIVKDDRGFLEASDLKTVRAPNRIQIRSQKAQLNWLMSFLMVLARFYHQSTSKSFKPLVFQRSLNAMRYQMGISKVFAKVQSLITGVHKGTFGVQSSNGNLSAKESLKL